MSIEVVSSIANINSFIFWQFQVFNNRFFLRLITCLSIEVVSSIANINSCICWQFQVFNNRFNWHNRYFHVSHLFQFSRKVEVLILLFTFLQIYSVIRRGNKVDNFADYYYYYYYYYYFLIFMFLSSFFSGFLSVIQGDGRYWFYIFNVSRIFFGHKFWGDESFCKQYFVLFFTMIILFTSFQARLSIKLDRQLVFLLLLTLLSIFDQILKVLNSKLSWSFLILLILPVTYFGSLKSLWVYGCLGVNMYMYLFVYLHAFVYMYIGICVYVCVCVIMFVCECICYQWEK